MGWEEKGCDCNWTSHSTQGVTRLLSRDYTTALGAPLTDYESSGLQLGGIIFLSLSQENIPS